MVAEILNVSFTEIQESLRTMTSQSPQRNTPLYEPLLTSSREIRLLVLEPYTNTAEAIRCSLIKDSLKSNHPKYEAIL
jgi:hypothetical protein